MRIDLGHRRFLNLLQIQGEMKNRQNFHPHEWIDLSQYQSPFVHAVSGDLDDDGKGNGGNLGNYGGSLGNYGGSFGSGGNLGRRSDD